MRVRSLLFVALLARLAAAQATDTIHRAIGATVSGIVRDSIAGMPLAGALVQLLAADSLARFNRTAVSDSLGRFTLGDVADGRYTIGFLHPMLDSLGIEPPLREVYIDGHRPVSVDLAIPSPARIRAAICGPRPVPDSGTVVIGVVRDARDRAPAAGVTVTGEWLEISFRREGLARRIPRLVATTAENGWFAMCDVPNGGTMFLIASRGADSTDLIQVEVPAAGFLRRELYLGPVRAVATGDSTSRADAVAPPPRRLRLGDGQLRGTVVTADGSRPLPGALVRITDGPQARANERGEWTLVDAPAGTRMLEVRAIGYFPERRPVDVVAGAAPVRVALSTFKAVLDTVRITAARLADRHNSGFANRRRSGVGRYLTPEDIARRGAGVISDLFRTGSGVRIGFGSDTLASGMARNVRPSDLHSDRLILMRGIGGRWCAPQIFVDGIRMPQFSADDLDGLLSPKDIAGVEIYSDVSVPADYQLAMSGCGSIVIWTK